jgi:multiple sugar transport system ATP-binding protein
MQLGKVEQVATPHDLFSKPTNLFVASFIGTPQMNLMPATLTAVGQAEANDSVSARFSLLGESISARVAKGVAALGRDAKVTLGIRPRSFEFANGAGADALHASVDLIEPLGAEMLIHLVEQGVDMRCVVPSAMNISVGDRVSVRCKSGQLHVFDNAGKLVG